MKFNFTLFLAAALTLGTLAASAQTAPEGQLKVAGKTVKFTQVYAYAAEGFFDKATNDTIVLLTDHPLTNAQVHDRSALQRLAQDGKLAYLQETISAAGKIINFTIGHQSFKAPPSGGSTEHVFEGKIEPASISGKVQTNGEQTSFGTKYEYEATFSAPVQPRK